MALKGVSDLLPWASDAAQLGLTAYTVFAIHEVYSVQF